MILTLMIYIAKRIHFSSEFIQTNIHNSYTEWKPCYTATSQIGDNQKITQKNIHQNLSGFKITVADNQLALSWNALTGDLHDITRSTTSFPSLFHSSGTERI